MRRFRQAFSRTQIPGHPLPTPRVDEKPQGAESLDVGVLRHVRCFPVARILATDQVVGLQRAHGLEDLGLFAMYGCKAPIGRRLHGKQGDDLEEVVLDHVSQTAGRFVERAAVLHAEILG